MTDHRAKLRILDELSAPMLWSEIEARPPMRSVDPAPRRLRAGTIALAIAIAVAGTVFAVRALGPGARPTASLDTSTWSSHDIPALHLRFNHPPQWHVQPFDELVGHAGMIGSVVSNVDHRFRHPDLGPNHHTSAWDLRSMPDDGVVISVENVHAIGVPTEERDSDFPLSLDQARRTVEGTPNRYFDRGWVELWLPFTASGLSDSVFVWFGPDASDHDREVARRIVASIRLIDR